MAICQTRKPFCPLRREIDMTPTIWERKERSCQWNSLHSFLEDIDVAMTCRHSKVLPRRQAARVWAFEEGPGMACEDRETTQARAKGTVANSTRLKTGRLWANLPSRLGERSRKGIFFFRAQQELRGSTYWNMPFGRDAV